MVAEVDLKVEWGYNAALAEEPPVGSVLSLYPTEAVQEFLGEAGVKERYLGRC